MISPFPKNPKNVIDNSAPAWYNKLLSVKAAPQKKDFCGSLASFEALKSKRRCTNTVINFTSEPDFPAELDRVYKITEGVMRSLIVAKED